jgi:mono/diheme cytochrome c family protein
MTQSTASKPFFLRFRSIFLILLAFVLSLAIVAWYYLFREVPEKYYANDGDHFSYASIGTENKEGLPMPIWKALPELFADRLPETPLAPGDGVQAYAAFGLLTKPGRDLPVGITSKTIGFERQGINCALCHTTSFRKSAGDVREVVSAGPATLFDSQGYLRFLFGCAKDPRFNADNLMPLINRDNHLNPIEKLLYRYILIPQTRSGILSQAVSYGWMDSRPAWGPGRIDPFNPVKFRMLGLADDGTIGNSDMMPLWNMATHKNFNFHWDGLEGSLRETNLEGALGDGATLKSLNLAGLDRVENYINQAQPPAYPFAIDQAKASEGEKVFASSCASCHGAGGAKTGSVIPISELGTDPNRIAMWTQAAVDAYSKYADGYSFDFKSLQKHDGYVAVGLEGLWLRGPYLHNGSVPNLKSLLAPPADRPQKFFRGVDIIDPDSVGYVTAGKLAEDSGWLYDTSIQGNSNKGHTYGTDLSNGEKTALLEYLKTL